jgi:hypothetical protein
MHKLYRRQWIVDKTAINRDTDFYQFRAISEDMVRCLKDPDSVTNEGLQVFTSHNVIQKTRMEIIVWFSDSR